MSHHRAPLLLAAAALACQAGCATMMGERPESLVPTRYRIRTGPYSVVSNVPITADDAVIRHLRSLEDQVSDTLDVRVEGGEDPIEIYILNDRKAFSHFLQFYYPALPARRAFFLAQGQRRVVYTFFGDRLEEDLRHEATHALLHAAVGDIPLWLDEGLAEYFECPPGRKGLNAEHLARLPRDRDEGWQPDLARLERLDSIAQMTPRDYRESWAWVHYLLSEPGPRRRALLEAVSPRHPDRPSPPLSERLARVDESAGPHMLAHIDHAGDRPVASADADDPTVRLQNDSAEPAPRKGFFARMARMFGR